MHMSKGFECGKHKMLNSNLKRMGSSPSSSSVVFAVLFLVLNAPVLCHGGKTSSFVRKVEKTVDMPLDSDVFRVPPSYMLPNRCIIFLCVFYFFLFLFFSKVHITQGDHVGKAVIVSWVTANEPGSKKVIYWSENSEHKEEANSKVYTYKFYNYTSGYIHHCTIRNLEGLGTPKRKFWFTTPPAVGPDVPYTFGLIGDLGQSYDSNTTLTHYEKNPTKGQAVLFVGDLSYADNYPNHDNVRWDTWGRFVERSVAYQPWIWTAGNHEIDFAPEIGETKPFKPFTHRYHVPYRASQSTAPFWYSIKRASAYIIVLSSYSAYGTYTPQYNWLEEELPKVNRSETPWLIVLMHSPWYNSYNYHYMEGETMRVMYERWFVQYKVDVVFAGHVHAYERSERISNIAYNIVNGKCVPVRDQTAPVYITIGDGGNLEGLATNMTYPQPEYSAYREASFGHAIFDIKNRTHAYYGWHRNQDGYAVEADTMWFYNRYWHPVDDSTNSEPVHRNLNKMTEPIDNSNSNKEINNGSTESINENNSNNDEENKKKNKKVDPELFCCLLQPITSDFGPRYIGIRRLLLFRKARSGVHRRLAKKLGQFAKPPKHSGKQVADTLLCCAYWLTSYTDRVMLTHLGRWLQSTSPLSHLFEVDSWTSSQNLRSINPSSTRRTSFSSTASDNDSLHRQGPEPVYSFVGMHCIFDQCKAAVTVLKFGYMSSDVSEPPSVIKKLEGHSKDVTDFDFSSNNQYIASAFMDKTVRVWELSKGICIRVLYGVSSQMCIGFHPCK
ncbi:hypothetical protein NC651_023301 [Populus alba x Populus x berolinensis]|nr:hypothetical protein NC651_023301 [Populus alba x Populus x berolinensis]